MLAAVRGVSTDLTYATSEGMCVPQETMTSALVVSLLFIVYFIYYGRSDWSIKIVRKGLVVRRQVFRTKLPGVMHLSTSLIVH